MEKVLAYAAAGSRQVQTGLGKARVEFRQASDRKGLDRELREFAPTLVLADVSMPHIDAATLLKSIRSRSDAVVVIMDSSVPGDVSRVVERLRLETQPSPGTASRSEVPSVEDVHDPVSGRLDAARMADWMGVSLARFAKFMGRSPQTVHKTPSGQGLQDRLAEFARVAMSLKALFGTKERARVWLNSPNRDLDGMTPISLFERRKTEIVAELLEDALLGHPG